MVTGAGRGLGRAVAERLLADGRRVAAVGRDPRPLEDLVARSEGRAVALPADLEVLADVEGLFARARAALGPLDGLVACAGIAEHRPLSAVDAALIDRHHAVNVRAPLLLTRDFAGQLEGPEGAVVLVSSTLGLAGAPHTTAYAASKGALIAACRSMALELAPRVRISCIAPGGIDTDMVRGRGEAGAQALAALHPLGRLASADEVAATLVHALDARFVTGSVWVVDGGLTAG